MRTLVVLVLLMLVARPGVADPDVEPLPADPVSATVVASDDPAFQAAIKETLTSAGLSVEIVTNEPPPSVADITSASRQLAAREAVTSTVWLLFAGENATLIVYDRGVDRVLVRSLPYAAPLAPAQAAEAARMTRTMLRAVRETTDESPAPRRVASDITVVVPAVVPATALVPAHRLAIAVDAGIRVRGPGPLASPSGALAVIWRPEGFGLALTGRFAPREDVSAQSFSGRISDQSAAFTARLSVSASSRMAVAGSAGVAIHMVALEGAVNGERVGVRRFNPAARLGAVATYDIGPAIGVGLDVSADWLLRRQAYETPTMTLLSVPAVQLSLGVVLVARIR